MTYGLSDETVQKIRQVFQTFPQVKQVILYGSRAKGTHRPGSDIDLAIQGENLDLHVLNEIRTALEELQTPYTFDISIFDQIESPDLINHIQRVGKVFFDS